MAAPPRPTAAVLLALAWRDSRGARRRLALYVSAMALGVAALVAIRSFGVNLQRAVEAQAREVFGSDLQVRRDSPYTPEHTALLDSLAAEHPGGVLRETTFPSMARFPAAAGGEGRARLVQVRALDGEWPLVGQPTLVPDDARLADGTALVDATLMLQMEAEVGDTVRVGRVGYRIAARVDAVPGQTDVAALVGPRIYLPAAGLDSTLLSFGSRARYLTAFRFDGGEAVAEAAITAARPRLEAASLRYETAREQQADVSEASRALERFLALVGLIALVLGGVGVASAMGLYVREKAETVATLRCLGLSSGRVFAVYAAQALGLGIVGAVLGAALGVAVQQALPALLGAFLPVDVPGAVVPRALAEGLGVGVVAAVLFALLPLARVRRVPPLRALRADAAAEARAEGGRLRWFDPLQIGLGALLVVGVGGFAFAQTGSLVGAASFVVGMAAVFGLLAAVAVAVRWAVVRAARTSGGRALPWAWRQGLAHLAAPGNQTLVLLVALGLGVFLVLALGLVQRSILDRIAVPATDAATDLVLFDVQPAERDSVRALLASEGVTVVGETPMVSMRLAAVDGVPVDSLVDRSDRDAARAARGRGRTSTEDGAPARWALTREYRSTYREATTSGEEVTAGRWVGRAAPDADVAPVSLEIDLARDLGVGLGDRLTWDVGGVPVESEITSLRRVDWSRPQPNFFAVFAAGPLDEAPQTGIVLAQAGAPETSARVQSRLADAFPTVSAVDVAQVVALVDRVLGRVAWALRFMALFVVGTGLVVLAGAVRVALAARTREAVLMRTLGASRAQVRRVLVAEYALLGVLAAVAGGVLAVGGGWALSRYAFEIPFRLDPTWLAVAFVAVPTLTAAIGVVGSRRALAQPPLDILREEE